MSTTGQFRITPGFGMNNYQDNLAGTDARTSSERHIANVREQGGVFVEAVRLTRMPMLVTDPTLPGNPIIFTNRAFIELSGYTEDELLGQDPHFMNGEQTEAAAIRQYESLFRNSALVRGWGDVVTRLREVEWSGPMGFQGVAETLWRSPCGPRPPVSSIVELPPVTKPI